MPYQKLPILAAFWYPREDAMENPPETHLRHLSKSKGSDSKESK